MMAMINHNLTMVNIGLLLVIIIKKVRGTIAGDNYKEGERSLKSLEEKEKNHEDDA